MGDLVDDGPAQERMVGLSGLIAVRLDDVLAALHHRERNRVILLGIVNAVGLFVVAHLHLSLHNIV